jgi:hypothetical protein
VDPDTDRSAMPLLIVFPFLLNILDTENTEIFNVFSLALWRKYPSIVINTGQGDYPISEDLL